MKQHILAAASALMFTSLLNGVNAVEVTDECYTQVVPDICVLPMDVIQVPSVSCLGDTNLWQQGNQVGQGEDGFMILKLCGHRTVDVFEWITLQNGKRILKLLAKQNDRCGPFNVVSTPCKRPE